MKEQCLFIRDIKHGKVAAALSRERRDVLQGEEEDGEWKRMGHRYPGKIPDEVSLAAKIT